ncbi:polyamine transporter 4 [Verticillium dahliae VdLs.17]|uniref:Polyamine transporter 4 n=3 Tax=Verticillium TaxID=1036719 RepID=G2XC91_VERDV|nr:polyamine transporter 4 [Verticillium dahliae VdLs.17]EGY16609.1 polyamine transporter 4 [Verticillium dahliae VdLs.17]
MARPQLYTQIDLLEVKGLRRKRHTPTTRRSMDEPNNTEKDVASPPPETWEQDSQNPLNWPSREKFKNTFIASISAFTASVGTSLPSSATYQYQEEFGVNVMQSILPLSMYVFALGLGPVLGGPLSETVGRHPIYAGSMFFGALFTVGAGLTHNFGALCFLRFMAGFSFSPSLAVGAGTISDMFHPAQRGLPSTLFILMPFLGPGFGPVIGSFVVVRKGWRWTQWTLVFFATASLLVSLAGKETYRPILERRRAKRLGHPTGDKTPLGSHILMFLRIALVRPLHMLFTEPIITFVALYVACEFATLFAFFAGVPYVFRRVHGFSIEQSGLVFISIVIGCLLGAVTIIVLTVVSYLPRAKQLHPERVPPEYRLIPAMFGSIGLPISLFMFGWTARDDISWAVPAFAIIIFAWGNLCIFVSTIQYTVDTYTGANVASGASANGFARYTLAGVLPLFTVQMYRSLGIPWAASLLAFVSLALAPVPWVLFKWGHIIRKKSRYETA